MCRELAGWEMNLLGQTSKCFKRRAAQIQFNELKTMITSELTQRTEIKLLEFIDRITIIVDRVKSGMSWCNYIKEESSFELVHF